MVLYSLVLCCEIQREFVLTYGYLSSIFCSILGQLPKGILQDNHQLFSYLNFSFTWLWMWLFNNSVLQQLCLRKVIPRFNKQLIFYFLFPHLLLLISCIYRHLFWHEWHFCFRLLRKASSHNISMFTTWWVTWFVTASCWP